MKKVVNAGIGNVPFVIEEDAYQRLSSYLAHFRSKLTAEPGQLRPDEVMEDLEERIAELFGAEISPGQVITIAMVEKVIEQLGMPDGSSDSDSKASGPDSGAADESIPHKLYRDPLDKAIAGVCSGLAAYFDIDVVLVRIIFVAISLLYGSGCLVYLIFWIICPAATTPVQQCELRGIVPSAENMAKYRTNGK